MMNKYIVEATPMCTIIKYVYYVVLMICFMSAFATLCIFCYFAKFSPRLMSMEKLKEQIEFYFSDSNYSRDKFMIAKASENDGFIPISVLLTFKRLQAMSPSVDQIKEAVRDSKIVEIKDNLLRKVQTQEFKDYLNDKQISKRVLYMKGFGLDSTLDKIKEILERYCKPVRITMRRSEDRRFKGSCFVEFSSKEEAEAAINLKIEDRVESQNEEQVKKQKVEPSLIEIMTKEDYLSTKNKGKDEKKDEIFGEKVKNSFIPKLFRFECSKDLDVKEIKQAIKDCAFVDAPKKVIRMKFAEEWTEKEFNISDDADKSNSKRNEENGSKNSSKKGFIKLIKMTEEEAKEYLKGITIKRIGKNNK
ncbi:uncharacterized protein VICG_01095 [Vittaforma corneae ATCC 50505]|uniref:HTH La-type RNA-binding domain-containing protein n=1 Tax=Vittaforma corneae (strain ATCC 50505) TaxID=993615 RepID=L2GM42_VITCO|nr:uncharacterized protein VICG_01095 [Vittaforma corneae ATCC 50505]ELA41911.1 hypothetical protein VICG_01095 [Vittaforma corneae ATCC 50505]